MKAFFLKYTCFLCLLSIVSCTDDEELQPPLLHITMDATLPNGNNDDLTTTIESFLIGTRQLGLIPTASQNVFTAPELAQPLETVLVQNSTAQESSVRTVQAPYAEYKGLQFSLTKGTEPGTLLQGKSFYIKGVVGGYPFVFWHSGEESVLAEFPPTNRLVVQGEPTSVRVIFPLDQFFSSMSPIDYAQLRDLNGDGLYEVSPVDSDGNQQLAQQMYEHLKQIVQVRVE